MPELKEMQLSTLEERKERGDLFTIYKLMSNLEETDRKYLILRRKEEAGNLRGEEKIGKRNLLKWHKKVAFPKEV